MIEQAQKIDAGATWFETFILAHPVVTCIALAWVGSWVLTILLKKPLCHVVADDWEAWWLRMLDSTIATGIVAYMWPGDHVVVWALVLGPASPVAYLILAALLCWWRPALKPYLSLPEFLVHETPKDAP